MRPEPDLIVKSARARIILLGSLVAACVQTNTALAQDSEATTAASETVADVVTVTANRNRLLPTSPSESSFGFNKSVVDTPRSVSMISKEAIELYGLTAVEDLVTLVPGVFTTTRFGIQGSIDVRNVSADTYFRGMKRVNLQGHARSVLAAMDNIEVVKGPPSPLYGMGKIGGYTNMSPKAGRAANGAYLEKPEGFSQALLGSFDRREFSAGVGGPFTVGGKSGGYYAYGLIEDSDTYSRSVDIGQKIIQAAMSVDNVFGEFRMESGVNYQRSTTQGALTHRVTQGLIDDLEYVRGTPLVNMDMDGSGKIGYYEMNTASPVRGNLSASNQPLSQRFDWPLDANGKPLPIDQFPVIAGIPTTMLDYLNANPAADPTGLLRAQGAGGPLPRSGQVPVGFVLDPRTTGYDTLDVRRSGAFEKELQADLRMAYLDFVNDSDPDFTIKNQMFVDNIDQFKNSEQPGGGKQDVLVLEDKFTVTKRLQNLPLWLAVNTLGSVNYRMTKATGYRYGGDFSTHRMDLMSQIDPMTPNTSFAHPFDNPNLNAGGAPWTSDYETKFSEAGVGVLLDIDVYEKANLMLGGRYDNSKAENTEFAGTFNPTTGRSTSPGAFRTTDDYAKNSDNGFSWSASLSYDVTDSIRPYATFAEASVALDTSNNKMDNATIIAGHVGSAELKEFGVKGGLFDDRLFYSGAYFEQTRTSITETDPGSVLGAEVSSTLTEGYEAEIKYFITQDLYVSVYGLQQETKFMPNRGADILVDARTLGFRDVVDAQGNVIYPAEAFLYGGRAFVTLPNNLAEYEIKQGNPETQFGFNTNYTMDNGFGFTLSGNVFSSTYSGRLKLVKLPAVETMNLGAFYKADYWQLKLDIKNVFDTEYFRARTGDTLGETLVQAMPGRTMSATFNVAF